MKVEGYCQYCGKEQFETAYWYRENTYFVRCRNCKATGPSIAHSEEEAIRLFNTRHDGPEQGEAGDMTGNPTAGIVAEKLVSAYDLVSISSFIICDIVDSGNEPTKDKLDILRDYLMDTESALSDVIVALVGHTLAEVE